MFVTLYALATKSEEDRGEDVNRGAENPRQRLRMLLLVQDGNEVKFISWHRRSSPVVLWLRWAQARRVRRRLFVLPVQVR
jgi:hypothetical protein